MNLIKFKDKNKSLLSKVDSSMQETIYLNSIPGMVENIIKAGKEPIEECIKYDENEKW